MVNFMIQHLLSSSIVLGCCLVQAEQNCASALVHSGLFFNSGYVTTAHNINFIRRIAMYVLTYCICRHLVCLVRQQHVSSPTMTTHTTVLVISLARKK